MSKDINKKGDQRRKDDYDGQGYYDLINGKVKVVFEKKYPYTEGLVYEYYDSLITILKQAGEVKKLEGFSTKIGNIIDKVHNYGYSPSVIVTDLSDSVIDKESRKAINNLLGRYKNAYLYGDFKPEEFEELLIEICHVYTTRPDDFRLGDMISSVKNSMGGRYTNRLIILNDIRHHKSAISSVSGRTTLNQFLNRVYSGMAIFSLNRNNTVRDYQLSTHRFNFDGYIRYWHSLEKIEEVRMELLKRIEEQRQKTYNSFERVVTLVSQLGLASSGKNPNEIVDSLINEKARREFWRSKIKEEKKKFSSSSHEKASEPALTITELNELFKSNRKGKRRGSSGNSP